MNSQEYEQTNGYSIPGSSSARSGLDPESWAASSWRHTLPSRALYASLHGSLTHSGLYLLRIRAARSSGSVRVTRDCVAERGAKGGVVVGGDRR